jgi:putative spermidine/putrescine transport system permease protein/spermidine/putrescine transport system permease protein
VLLELGAIDEPLNLIYNYFCTLIGMVHVMLPTTVLPLYAAMRSIDRDLVNAAASLGAAPTYAFWKVFFPLTLPGLVAGCTIVFTLSLGYYVIPSILGGGKVIVWAIFVEQAVGFNVEWGPAAAAGILLLGTTVLVLALAHAAVGAKVNLVAGR